MDNVKSISHVINNIELLITAEAIHKDRKFAFSIISMLTKEERDLARKLIDQASDLLAIAQYNDSVSEARIESTDKIAIGPFDI